MSLTAFQRPHSRTVLQTFHTLLLIIILCSVFCWCIKFLVHLVRTCIALCGHYGDVVLGQPWLLLTLKLTKTCHACSVYNNATVDYLASTGIERLRVTSSPIETNSNTKFTSAWQDRLAVQMCAVLEPMSQLS